MIVCGSTTSRIQNPNYLTREHLVETRLEPVLSSSPDSTNVYVLSIGYINRETGVLKWTGIHRPSSSPAEIIYPSFPNFFAFSSLEPYLLCVLQQEMIFRYRPGKVQALFTLEYVLDRLGHPYIARCTLFYYGILSFFVRDPGFVFPFDTRSHEMDYRPGTS